LFNLVLINRRHREEGMDTNLKNERKMKGDER
jgi:hypothetical protein